MRRVLQIMGGLNRGGLESFAMNLYRAIDKEQIQFDFLLTQLPGGDYAEEAKSLGARIYTLPARNQGLKAYKNALDDFFRNHHDYIAIHEHISSLTSIAPAYYAKKYGIPVRIFHSHSSSVQKNLKFYWLHVALHYLNKPKVHSWGTVYLGCSDKALDWMYNLTGVRKKAVMVNNGIDCSQYEFNTKIRKEVRNEFEIKDEDFVIGHVGRFIPLKNQAFLIDVIAEVIQFLPSVKLIMVGEGDTLNHVKEYAVQKNVTDNVIFTGVRSDVNRLMQAMDVLAMPSWFEGLPVSLVEAQATGLPIVASDTISHDSDLTGTILFKSLKDSALDWGKAIVEWAKTTGRPENIDKIKRCGFDTKSIAKQLTEIYYGKETTLY